jgi:hypothetical protein
LLATQSLRLLRERSVVKIRLLRLHNGELLGQDVRCALRGVWFPIESVLGILDPPSHEDGEAVCTACVEYFGERNPEEHATIAEYREAVRRYLEPVWASCEEISRADHKDAAAYERTFDASWIGRHRPEWASS